ncbi:hypothetical protein A2515_02845 [Candidatus Falkowbacteria bacterium RIFOXYD12_FULL_34_57]|nr:MAG: hypothetical protein A2515_02845 [Candidatus Falkowbacteria bacterium RIFOXYD12_FULL_34_57]
MVPIIDVVLLIILSGFVFYGLFFGLIRTVGSLIGLIIGAVIASRYYLAVYGMIDGLFIGFDNLGKVLVFVILFSFIHHVVGIGFFFIDRTFNILSIIPFLKSFNRLGGGILGALIGSLSIGLVLYVASRYTFIESIFGRWLINSELTPYFLKINNLLLPLLPEMLKMLKSLI